MGEKTYLDIHNECVEECIEEFKKTYLDEGERFKQQLYGKKCVNPKYNKYCCYAYGTRCNAGEEQYQLCKSLGIDKAEADKKFHEENFRKNDIDD